MYKFDGPYENCAAPCVDNWILHHIFFVSAPTRAESWDAQVTFSLIWSLVPTLLVLFPAIFFFKTRTTTPLIAACLIGTCSVFNKVMASLVGLSDSSYKYRPGNNPAYIALHMDHTVEASCVKGAGMPSGHSTNAMGAFTWFVLETWRGYGVDHNWSTRFKTSMTLVAAFVCWPALPARVGIYDHTWAQVTAGGGQGIIVGCIAYALLRTCIGPHLRRCCEILNDRKNCFGCFLSRTGLTISDSYWKHTGEEVGAVQAPEKPGLYIESDVSKVMCTNV